mmetsp:Transcript_75512/g.179366  ORF Transcript_75512/g.179366 Transcript_75512/m.179366 type:complete len:666 (+) Transcript_75512:40-2037(+)
MGCGASSTKKVHPEKQTEDQPLKQQQQQQPKPGTGTHAPAPAPAPRETEKPEVKKDATTQQQQVAAQGKTAATVGAAGLMDGNPLEDKLEGGMALFIIDPQNDFHPKSEFHEAGSLAVPGACEDSNRIVDLIQRCGSCIERIVVTLDTHHIMHIHHKHFWIGIDDKAPDPFTVITLQDLREKKWRSRFPEQQAWAEEYVQKLEEGKRFPMIIWPDHCLLGTEGHAVYPPLFEALNAWASSRCRAISWYFKGANNNVEMYSALKAEVPSEHDPSTLLGEDLVKLLARHEKVICCGEALSHCVNTSVRDLEGAWPEGRTADIVVLEDGASPVAGFEEVAQTFVKDMREKGVTVCKAADITPDLVKSVGSSVGSSSAYGCRIKAAGLMNGVPKEDSFSGGAALLIIDPQKDFHDPDGSLAVKGASGDSHNTAAFLRQHKDKIERIVVTLDTHHVMHIHHPDFWTDANDKQPDPFVIIEQADVEAGKWKPRQAELLLWALEYVKRLEAGGRFKLCVWPRHCLLGGPGHAVETNLMQALNEWAVHRGRAINWYFKGQNNRSEMYSAFKAEVELSDDTSTQLGLDLVNLLARHDKVYCCGQALSHCVNHSVRDLVSAWPKAKADIVLLKNCSSPVRLPDGTPFPEGAQFLEWAQSSEGGISVCTSDEVFIP